MPSLKKVVVDDLYETIDTFVKGKEVTINDYDTMVEMVLSMMKEGYCFTMDRDILRDAMESLTYMYSPDDDMNKDRVIQQLLFDDDSDDMDEEDEDDQQVNDSDILNLMKMMGMSQSALNSNEEVVVKKEEECNQEECNQEDNECPVTNEACDQDCCENTCKKQEESEEVN